jgi:hypothetical protein
MALWQFDLLLVSRRHLPGAGRSASRSLAVPEVDSVDWWAGYRLDSASERLIQCFATPRDSWDPETRSWGEEDGDRLDVTLEDGQVVEIIARMDARHIHGTFIQGIVALAVHLDGVFLTKDLDVIPPVMHEVSAALESSAARRFVRDPYTFLESGDSDVSEW